jgi:CBS domain-containing protein
VLDEWPACIAPDSSIRDASALLLERGADAAAVVDDVHGLVGMLTRTDLLRALATEPPLEVWV